MRQQTDEDFIQKKIKYLSKKYNVQMSLKKCQSWKCFCCRTKNKGTEIRIFKPRVEKKEVK